MESFNSIGWINQLIPQGSNLSYNDLEPVLSFSLIWNLFEKITCNNNANLNRIQADINKCYENNLLHIDDFRPFLVFFNNRYVVNGNIDDLPGNLRLSDRKHIQLLSDVLTNNLNDINNVVFALLIIAYRIRNNLFHGEKDIYTLDTQLELFQVVNALLAKYLEVGHPGYHG